MQVNGKEQKIDFECLTKDLEGTRKVSGGLEDQWPGKTDLSDGCVLCVKGVTVMHLIFIQKRTLRTSCTRYMPRLQT